MPENYGVFIGNLTEELCNKLIQRIEDIKMLKYKYGKVSKRNSQYYIGVNIVEAFPIDRDGKPGYTVILNGEIFWSSKEDFEHTYFLMGAENNNKVTQEMVEQFFLEAENRQLDEKTVLVKGKTLTGFLHYEIASCVDHEIFDMTIGSRIATRRIQEVIYKLLVFVVQWGRFGLNSLKEQEQTEKSVTELDDSFVCRE